MKSGSCDLERQVFCTEVLLCAEGDRQPYTTYVVHSFAGHDPIEGLVAGGHLVEVELHLAQRLYDDDIQAIAPVVKGLRQEGPVDYGVDDQRVSPEVRDVDPMIFPGESD
jgi:hypothetical protein